MVWQPPKKGRLRGEIVNPRSNYLAHLLVQILRLHRFSRVVHREPSVPSKQNKGPTLYERRDKLRKTSHDAQTFGKLVAGSSIDAS